MHGSGERSQMSSQTGAPERELPPTHCPVCLERWDASSHLPKFLSCHHSVCVSCVALLHDAALEAAPTRRSSLPRTPSSPLARIMGPRGPPEPEEPVGSSRVKCPLCRTPTLVLDPTTLQTNFYLRGLLRHASLPRLVLWCEACSCVALPDCAHHSLTPLRQKMRQLQEEVEARADEAYVRACDRSMEYERQVEVYGWLCGLLRHGHEHVCSTYSLAQDQQRAMNQRAQVALAKVKEAEALQGSEQPREEVIKDLLRVVGEVQDLHDELSSLAGSPPGLVETFRLLKIPRGPRGYHRAQVVLEASDCLTISFFGEDQAEGDVQEGCKRRGNGIGRFHTLQEKRREGGTAPPTVPVKRATSLCQPGSRRDKVPQGSDQELCPAPTAVSLPALLQPVALTQPPALPQAGLPHTRPATHSIIGPSDEPPAKPSTTCDASSDSDAPQTYVDSGRRRLDDDEGVEEVPRQRGRGRGGARHPGRGDPRGRAPPRHRSKTRCCVM